MIKIISDFFKKECIEYYGVLPIEECKIQKDYLLNDEDFVPRSVICFLVPYYTQNGENLSKYAVSKDYHLYMNQLFEGLSNTLKTVYPQNRIRGFADHSPIFELEAAAKCGLGVIGENRLLINEKYSSFVFIGDIFTDIDAKLLGYVSAEEPKSCLKCGKCKVSCPTGALNDSNKLCLSAITQRKGELSDQELSLIINNNTVWGCDICQNVCPYTLNAITNGTIQTPIKFFYEDIIHKLTSDVLENMNDDEFNMRVYSWRKRETIRRNLILTEEAKAKNEKEEGNKA